MDEKETLEVRFLGAADAEAFRAIRLEALQSAPEAYGSTFADFADAPLARFEARLANSHVAGAVLGGDLIGIAALDRDGGGNARHRGYVTAVYVRPAARGRGVAAALLDHLAHQARAVGILQLELHVAEDNAAAIAAYQRVGYGMAGLSPRALFCNGRFIDEHLMMRIL